MRSPLLLVSHILIMGSIVHTYVLYRSGTNIVVRVPVPKNTQRSVISCSCNYYTNVPANQLTH